MTRRAPYQLHYTRRPDLDPSAPLASKRQSILASQGPILEVVGCRQLDVDATACDDAIGCKSIILLIDFDDTGVGKAGIDNRAVESRVVFFLSIRENSCQGNRQDCDKVVSIEGARMMNLSS